jgi:hypothetical protein
MQTGPEERRRHPRRSVRFSAWFSRLDGDGYGPCWHYGKIIDVSMGGAKICSADVDSIQCGALVEILCLPELGQRIVFDATTPFGMHGRVIWRDHLNGVVGIAHE